jgi:hypothetical protein
MKQKTLGKLKQEVQKVVNEYIRKRDEGKPCISCRQFKTLQAGHYYPVKGYDGLRFEEDNIHGECEYCNCWDEGHLIGYSLNLPNRLDKYQLQNLHLEAKMYKQIGYKFTRSELQDIKKKYRDKLNTLNN